MTKFAAALGRPLAVLGLALALGACAKNTARTRASTAPMARGGGAGGGPGSYQEFSSSVGDRVFFETDQTDVNERGRRRSTSRPIGSTATAATVSRSRATPTSAARANTISRSARAAPRTVKNYLVAKGVSPRA